MKHINKLILLTLSVLALSGCGSSSKKTSTTDAIVDTSSTLIPVGSVVRVNQIGDILITGVAQVDSSNTIYDYSGCTYPSGCTGDNNYLFSRADIIKVYKLGYSTSAETKYLKSAEEQMAKYK